MDLVAIGMVLSAAVLHAVWNALAKRSDDALTYFFLISLAAIAIYSIPAMFVARNEDFRWDWLRFALASALLHAIYFAFLALAYSRSDLSFAYPVARGTGILLVPILAVPIFNERPTPAAWAGIGAVVGGIVLMHAPVFQAAVRREQIRSLISWPALATGLTIAVYSLNDTAGVRRANPIVYLYIVYVASAALLAPYILRRRGPALRRALQNRWPIVIGGVGSFGTYMIVLAATRLAPVSYVVPMRETSIVVGALIGARVLGESLGRYRIAGCITVVAGVLAIGIGG